MEGLHLDIYSKINQTCCVSHILFKKYYNRSFIYERKYTLETIKINGNAYLVECIPFEDRGEQDEDGYYDYYYKGYNLSFLSGKKIVKARIYDGEKIMSFFTNPLVAFGEDFKAIKVYVREEFGVNAFQFLDDTGYTKID